MKTLGKIVLAIVVLGLLYLAYRLIFKKPEDGTACDSDNDGVNDGVFLDGVCVKNEGGGQTFDPLGLGNVNVGGGISVNPALNSVRVSKSLVSAGQNPSSYFNNVLQSNMSSFNILTSATSNPEYIHFGTNFDSQCPQYVWYKKWLYVFVRENVVASTTSSEGESGEKNCYYRVDRNILPMELRVILSNPANSCPALTLFLSGAKYNYMEKRVEPPVSAGGPPRMSCVYRKQ